MEKWCSIFEFPNYSISTYGRVRRDTSGRILVQMENQYGVVFVGMMCGDTQRHRSVALLVATAFIPKPSEAFETPINLDGNRWNNSIDNLLWRPRWFAVQYNKQFKPEHQNPNTFNVPIREIDVKEVFPNSFACAKQFGLLDKDIVMSILNRTYVWPTYQLFEVYIK